MKLLDTNILIYSGEADFASLLLSYVTDEQNIVSIITKVETLGFSRITMAQVSFFESIFELLTIEPISNQVAERAIKLRQQRKMTLGDALIAATALEYNCTLVTRNISDFDWIKGLVLENPFQR